MALFMNVQLSRGLRITSTARHAIPGTFRDAAKIFAALLICSATPALAIQHGGGGHSGGGGGGHFSGGGGGHVASGGSHYSGGQHAPAPHPTSGRSSAPPAPHTGAPAAGIARPSDEPGTFSGSRTPEPAHIAEPGYVWEATPGYSNRIGPETPKDLGKRGFLWEQAPSNGAAGEKNSYFLTSNPVPRAEASPRAATAGGTFVAHASVSPHSSSAIVNRRPIPSASLGVRPARVVRTRSPFGFGRRRLFFEGFFPFGFFPGFFYEDCFAFGFADGFGPCGFGYYNPGFYLGDGYYSDYTANVTNDMTQSVEPPIGAPSKDEAIAPRGAEASTPGPEITVLFLKDGTSFGVTDYWLEGGRLHYVTTYGGANAIELDELDTQHTVDENAQHNVTFTLRPAH